MENYISRPGSRYVIYFWPLVCLIAGAVLWLFVDAKLATEKATLASQALKDTASLSRAYAAYLGRSLEQMDQITMHVKSDWERWNRLLKLEDLKKDGLFTASEFVAVIVVDSTGRPVTSTQPIDPNVVVADADYFLFHQSNISSALRVSKPRLSRLHDKQVIYFSRRLDTADDSFDGVVLVAVDPAYFLSFYDSAILGQAGLLAVLGEDGKLRAASIGGRLSFSSKFFNQAPPLDQLQRPILLHADAFSDQTARYMVSQEVKSYPLTVIVGLSEQETVQPYQQAWSTYRYIAYGGSAFLFLLALVGVIFGLRVSRREHAALALQKTYRLATESANEGFYIFHPLTDHQGEIIDWEMADSNERGAAFFGLSREGFIGRRLSHIYTTDVFHTMMDLFRVVTASGIYEDEYRVPAESPFKAKWLHRRLVRSEKGLAMTVRDISEAKKSEQELLRLANEDALTGLPNRHWLIRFLPLAMQRAQQNGSMLAVLFIDLDEFKNINDTLGHSAGDKLLKIAAQRVKTVLRPGDKIVRLGGDEFTVIIEQVADRSAAGHVAERIAQVLQAPVELGGGRQAIHASIGISMFPDDGLEAEVLLKHADIAMYSVKSAGKGHYQFYESHLYESLKQRISIEKSLRSAIENDHFVLHYQPRVHAVSGELCGMEALVRWRDPVRGIVPPLEFIPLAESTGLILPLGELVIDKACAQIAAWKTQQLPVVPVSVNVSARQFNQSDLKAYLLAAIERHAIDAVDIQVELTESAMMGEQAEAIAQLADMRSHGIKLLVDDFGTGYSSLSQLQRLDLDALKIDRAFTAELGKSAEGLIFFKAIVSMAHALGMKVTAEGVETMQQLAILRSLDCDEVQGYFIARPMPADDMTSFMLRGVASPTTKLA